MSFQQHFGVDRGEEHWLQVELSAELIMDL